MANTNYNEHDVIRILRRNSDINVSEYNKTITVKQNSTKVGNGLRGKIDYLINYCDYKVDYDVDFKRLKATIKQYQSEDVQIKHNKREKFNLTAMVKNNLKRIK